MNKIIIFGVFGILIFGSLGVVAVNENEKIISLSETVVFSQPIISERDDYISVELSEATSYSWEENKPAMPVVSKVFTFPFGTKIESVNVIFSKPIKQMISKPIICSPVKYIDSIANIPNKIQQSETVMTYSDIDVYPDYDIF